MRKRIIKREIQARRGKKQKPNVEGRQKKKNWRKSFAKRFARVGDEGRHEIG